MNQILMPGSTARTGHSSKASPPKACQWAVYGKPGCLFKYD